MLPYHFETLKKTSTEIYSEGKNLQVLLLLNSVAHAEN